MGVMVVVLSVALTFALFPPTGCPWMVGSPVAPGHDHTTPIHGLEPAPEGFSYAGA